MRTLWIGLAGGLVAATLGGCAVYPAPVEANVAVGPAYVAPAPVVVAPRPYYYGGYGYYGRGYYGPRWRHW